MSAWRRLLVEPARPAAVAKRADAHWLVVAAVCVGAFMGQLDASIVTLALPTIERDFHSSLGSVQWVGLIYLLVLVSTVATIGQIADSVGRKLLYVYGFVVFLLGSLACGLAPSLLALDAFRAVQALGAAMMQANSVAIIALALPRERLGRGIGVQGAAQALGLSMGPAVGGALIALGGWRLIFFVNVPIGIVGSAAAWLLIPRSTHLNERRRFDWPGLALFMPALSTLLLAVSFGNEQGWLSPSILALFAAAATLGAAFVRRERQVRTPLIDLTLFSRPAFAGGVASGLLSYLVLFGTLFAVPFFLENEHGLSPGVTGGLLTILPISLAVAAPLAGNLADKVGARPLTSGGMCLAAATLLVVAACRGNETVLLVSLVPLGIGLGAFTPPNNAAIMAAAPRSQAGAAGGILNLTRGLGTALGLALTGLVFGLDGFVAATVFLAGAAVAAALLTR
ncbi:MAG TPA: DHA2 family efflux MFS transporter permease subunit [Gaiellaceae bacterium]|jgi:EmrB/QacA subfamily drug resistance transporter|nr:DHA2 family efflux MFS transporter permease subunit [Gaiellaceae bacterium]